MAGQSVERREILQLVAFAAAAAGFPGFRRWTFACGHLDAAVLPPRPASGAYQPLFFTPNEYAIVERLAEMIIPSSDGPGAREAGVSEFIDFMMASDPNLQPTFRYGVDWLDGHSHFLYAKPFLGLDAEQQTDILDHLAYYDRHRAEEEEGRAFFQLMKEWTVKGYYTSKVGLEQIGYPGLTTVWGEYDPCPHRDDREHKHLPPPQI